MSKPVTIVAVGAGHRTRGYCTLALQHPDRMKVVAVVEPDPERRAAFAAQHAIAPDMQFTSHESLLARPKLADAAVNGTMDRLHHPTGMPLIAAGYHMLLEKPIATQEQHVRELIDAATRHERTVMICHVLRYAPFYATIKALLDGGRIGEPIALHSTEAVSYHHMAVSFIRGRWNNEATSTPMILSKCCHDLDIIAWMFSGLRALRVASFGSLKQFRRENAPAGSAERCLDGCKVEATCPYSAKAHYLEQGFGFGYPWEMFTEPSKLTTEQRIESLRTTNPYGRCVWRCDNDVVDHQSVIVAFENGVTASHDMFCATARPTRTIHILGSGGEIEGDMEANTIRVRTFSREPGKGYVEELIDPKASSGDITGGHGGGDGRLVEDFVAVLRGESSSKGVTRIQDSLTGHLIGFAAERSRRENRMVEIET